jgi:hypothetical protein
MADFEIVGIENERKWREALDAFPSFDFSFSYDYCKCFDEPDSENPMFGSPKIAVFRNKDVTIINPFIVRRIPIAEQDDFDVISPYGYAGPLSNMPTDESNWTLFNQMFTSSVTDSGYVSGFYRMHPILAELQGMQYNASEKAGEIVVMNLEDGHAWEKDLDRQCRKFIAIANQNGLEFRMGKSRDEVDGFFRLYSETMIRTDAELKYRFSFEFIDSLLKIEGSQLLQCYHGEKMISAAIGLEFSGISTYFLTGSDIANEVGMNNKLIFDTANYYKQRGCCALNLGGGISSRPGLRRFKKTFSKNILQFNISKHIYNNEKYNMYTTRKGVNMNDSDFFPSYRDQ